MAHGFFVSILTVATIRRPRSAISTREDLRPRAILFSVIVAVHRLPPKRHCCSASTASRSSSRAGMSDFVANRNNSAIWCSPTASSLSLQRRGGRGHAIRSRGRTFLRLLSDATHGRGHLLL